ncbi:AAA family ATPase [Micromonospora sp. NPDC049900]|uniref:AAA family ATPase n=1 Tax=Micromonospora sp. NPDC049900 TaxID=3364275 RepID=UPI0037884234
MAELVGRQAERTRIAQAIDQARAGTSATLVLRGEAGIGKTALLRYAAGLADDLTVVGTCGVQADAELEFSGLFDLCRPLLAHLPSVNEFQAAALRGALGLGPPGTGNRFVIGAATLELLAAAAEQRPVLVCVDDLQWVDQASAQAIRFAARRLSADPVAFLLCVRDEPDTVVDTDGFPQLRLGGLAASDAYRLLARATGRPVAEPVAQRLHTETGGNPLALTELVDLLTPEQLEETASTDRPLPVGDRIRAVFVARLAALPADIRLGALLVAATTDDRVEVVGAALSHAGLGIDTLADAEHAGLLSVADGRVQFRHPLLRAAVYAAAGTADRRAAHHALARATSGTTDPERHTWHLSQAALGPDETIAAALAGTADRARARMGFVAAAAALEQAARLTPDPQTRTRRLAEAASTALTGGDSVRAGRLADEAIALTDDGSQRPALLLLRGRIGMRTALSTAYDVLTSAADAAGADRVTAAEALCEAATASMWQGQVPRGLRAVRRARELVPDDGGPQDMAVDYTLGRLLMAGAQASEGCPVIERWLAYATGTAEQSDAQLVEISMALALLEREDEALAAAERAVDLARGRHPVGVAAALSVVMHLHTWAGGFTQSAAAGAEAVALLRDLGYANSVAGTLTHLAKVAALRGRIDDAQALLDQARGTDGFAASATVGAAARFSDALIAVVGGDVARAVEHFEAVGDTLRDTGWYDRDLAPEPELVAIHVAAGDRSAALRAFDRWQEYGPQVAPRAGAALSARCTALLATDDSYQEAFEQALSLHGQLPDRYATARTRLAYGERLRRVGRKVDARHQLRAAVQEFEGLDAQPWAERARRELRATGEKIRRTIAGPGVELTPQERQIVAQVAAGRTNKDVAAALFLSPKTVEFHLGRAFRKLAVTSRAELVRQVTLDPSMRPASPAVS